MKRILSFLLLTILCLTLVVPIAAEEYQPIEAKVLQTQTAVSESIGVDTAGSAILLIEGEKRLMREGMGYGILNELPLMTAETGFEIGELSSLFVVLAAHQLADEGVIDLEANIGEYLSSEMMDKLSLTYAVTVEDLLYGTAGFEGRVLDVRFEREAYCFDTLEEALLASVPRQVVPPRTYSAYSEFGIGLAALIVQNASGKEYNAYVTETILEPLEMKDTFLDPRGEAAPEMMANGYEKVSKGSFSLGDGNGRSYAAIMPASGAVSTLYDMEILLVHMMNEGLFAPTTFVDTIAQKGIAGATVSGETLSFEAKTNYFGASLCVDASKKSIALVLANTKDSALLSLPAQLFGATSRVEFTPAEELPALENFEGVFADVAYADNTLLGRLMIKNESKRAVVKDDVFYFGDEAFRQITPGVFARADEEENVAALQFLTDEEGNVIAVLEENGTAYRAVPNLLRRWVAIVLFILLFVLAVYFIGMAILLAIKANRKTGEGEEKKMGWQMLLPWPFAALLAAISLVQVVVALSLGVATFASFFSAMSILCTVFAVLAIIGFIVAFVFEIKKPSRAFVLILNAVLFLAFLFICLYWRILFFG